MPMSDDQGCPKLPTTAQSAGRRLSSLEATPYSQGEPTSKT